MTTITDTQIKDLRDEAAAAGDTATVTDCLIALRWAGSDDEILTDEAVAQARERLAQIIAEAQRMAQA